MNRRQFVRTAAVLSTGGAAFTGYSVMIEPHWLAITHRMLPIANLPQALEGATLAQLSDIHTCSYVDEDYLKHSLDRVGPLAPDIVVMTGDFVTWEHDVSERVKIPQLERVMAHFPKGRLATLAIPGNHDYGETWKDGRVAETISATVGKFGVRMLRNEVANVAGLDFIGIDDLWSGRADTARAFRERASDSAVALCHNPDGLDELPWTGYSGWILSGHTHGGQVKPPFLPPPVLPVKNHRYTSGEIIVDSLRKVYISRGIGHLYQVRFNVRPEIAIFTLRRA